MTKKKMSLLRCLAEKLVPAIPPPRPPSLREGGACLAVAAALCVAAPAEAQQPGPYQQPPPVQGQVQGGGTWNPPSPPYYGPGPQQPGYCPPGQWCAPAPGQPGPGGGYMPPKKKKSTYLEIGYLYGTSIAWGIGTGVWLDVEAEVENPGIAIIMPALFGAIAPVGVFIADYVMDGMPRGLPAAIATGLWLGGGAGLGVWAVHDLNMRGSGQWGFAGLGRATFVGSVVGGGAGIVAGALMEPSPKTSMFVLSATTMGTAVGGAFGAAGSQGNLTNNADGAIMIGGLIGYGVGLIGSGAASLAYVPSWEQIGFGWAGFAIGAAATTPVYFIYLGVDADPRTGLIAQGIGGLLGAGLGFWLADPDGGGSGGFGDRPPVDRPTLLGVAPTPMGIEVNGQPSGYGFAANGIW